MQKESNFSGFSSENVWDGEMAESLQMTIDPKITNNTLVNV
jgi:hypothetical protein